LKEKRTTIQERITIINEYRAMRLSKEEVCIKYKITIPVLNEWLNNYERYVIFSSNFRSQNNAVKSILSKATLNVLIGIPCSGKSFYAEKIAELNNAVIISTDEIRKELTGTYEYLEHMNSTVFEAAHCRIKEALSNNLYVIFDATNTNKKYRKKVISIAKKSSAKIIATVFQTKIDVCIERNSKRLPDRKIPNEKLRQWAYQSINVDRTEGIDEIYYV